MLQPKDRLAEWIQKQDPYIRCLQETDLRPQYTYRLKVRGWKNIFHTNGKQKKAGVAILVSKWKKESEVAQSCPTLCDTVDCSPPGSSVHGILQARILEWVAISFSRGSSWPRDRTQVSCIAGRLFHLWATDQRLDLFSSNTFPQAASIRQVS